MTVPDEQRRILVVGPDGTPVAVPMLGPGAGPSEPGNRAEENSDLAEAEVGEPAKVMRIGTMIKQFLEEVRGAPLDEASRIRLKRIHERSIHEWNRASPPSSGGVDRITLPFVEDRCPPTPNSASPRPSWSAGWRVCSTGSRRPSSPSRWRRRSSSTRCDVAGHSHLG